MGSKKIITIGRQLGSGGREIGKRLASRLDIPYYDKEILEQAAKNSGYSKEMFEKMDEKPTNSFLYSLAMGVNNYSHGYQRPIVLDLYLAQFETMKSLANEGGGVFIGRCADYVLGDMEDTFHVFVNADLDTRAKRVMEDRCIDEKTARDICIRNDKDRSSYYNYYSDTQWGDSRHYDLCINTGKIDYDKAVELIISSL